jgi:hypothetical protein
MILERFFYRLGLLVATNRIIAVSLCISIAIICSVGILRLKIDVSNEYLNQDRSSKPMGGQGWKN